MKFTLYTFLFSASLLTACSRSTGSNEATADTTATDTTTSAAAPDTTPGVTMFVSPSTFKATNVAEAKLTIANKATGEITLGEAFSVAYNEGGSWQKVTLFDSVMFTAIAHVLAPGETKEFPIHLQPMPYKYKPGQYRILKGAQLGEQAIELTAPFTVE